MTHPALAHLAGLPALYAAERRLRALYFAPPPRLTVTEWADRYRVLPQGSPGAGQWHTLPFQRPIMDALLDHRYHRVVSMLPSQTCGKTEIAVNLLLYHVHLAPSPMLFVTYNIEMAKKLSKKRIRAAFRDMPCLAGKLEEGYKRSDDTILYKEGPGWSLGLVGANSPGGLAMDPIRVLVLDEVDRYPASAGTEGDVLTLAEARTTNYPDARVYVSSTPGMEGASRIWKEWEQSTQGEWSVPCPHCNLVQPLRMGGKDEAHGLKWEKDADGRPARDSVRYLCAGCGTLIEEQWKHKMNAAGAYVMAHPEREVAGFHCEALVSPLLSWYRIARRWAAAAHDEEQRKAFINTVRALPYATPGERVDTTAIVREQNAVDAAGFPVVPLGAGLLTLWADVQVNRIEVLVTAWGAGEEAWHLYLTRLAGDPLKPEVWRALEALRTRVWAHASGAQVRVVRAGVDSGTWTASVADYVRPLERAGVMATKGSNNLLAPPLLNPGSKRSDKFRIRVWNVGTIRMKDIFFGRLQRVREPGPGYQHFTDGVDQAFLDQLGVERMELVRRGTQTFRQYVNPGKKPNEGIDLVVGNLAVLYSLGDAVRRQLAEVQASVVAAAPAPASADPAPAEPAEPAEELEPAAEPVRESYGGLTYDRPGRDWLSGWR